MYLFYVLVFFPTLVSAFYGSWWYWRGRQFEGGLRGHMGRLACLLFAIFLNWMAELVTNNFGLIRRPVFAPGFAVLYWALKTIFAICIVRLVMYLTDSQKRIATVPSLVSVMQIVTDALATNRVSVDKMAAVLDDVKLGVDRLSGMAGKK